MSSAIDTDIYAIVPTLVGPMRLVARDSQLVGAWFMNPDDTVAAGYGPAYHPETEVRAPDHPFLQAAAMQLTDWFAGRRRDFDLALAPRGTSFQQAVWQALCELPFGTLESYGDLARRIGRPAAVRAVAQAVGRNPISVIIPCHRIVGSDTSLTGFGGGLARKRTLLSHEGHTYGQLTPRTRRQNTDPAQGTLAW
ncbi:methylated-DNA--[protein]-cysteine S-methyltransferase [Achromobacter aloeverae]|uniref:Methylated-DNA--protein-cysteine methyltransferase n=1 Tax=Achromobacter aloeverae TaxID=1750518 RepID=A0A4Q1HMC1_9BURK|nr:methylated-DNA--[protein]-cysteine S-methyltransferase [Achromobacter aloeverae]RXN90337.1 cysteine methyltransferase [Achromobacter aloeverae]